MNKLNELAARAMGYDYPAWRAAHAPVDYEAFSPSTDMNDAAELLEKVTGGYYWEISKGPVEMYKARACSRANGQWFSAQSDSIAKTICLCALRAAGIPEQELQEAMRE